MKKFIYCLFILSILCFCGCSQAQKDEKESAQKNVEDTKDTHEGTERGKEVVETTPVPGRIENTETEEVLKEELPIPAYMRDVEDEVYRDLITKIVEEDIFPVSNYETDGPVYDQSYAILDIDGDGKEELIINYSGASSMAGMVYYVYDYERTTGEVYIECAGYPGVDFFDNGYVEEEASHNHGRSCLDDFWPYHLLKYNPEKDVYESIAHVDAWQKELYPEGFPVDADLDGDGIVYYTAPASYIPTEFMDKAEYEIWCEQYNKGTAKTIQWKEIISEEDYKFIYKSDEVKEELSTLAYMTDITDEVYRNLITEMLVTGKFPVISSERDLPHFYSYAVLDIDGDEREELLIVFSSTTHTPSWALYIYDYDRVTGAAYIEYWNSPDASFYDNGYVKVEESNNHGRSDLDDFWPYHLLIYNSEKDTYESITHVDAWQKELYEDGFPDDADKDGDGIVYYTSDIQFETPLSFMDKAEYDTWCEQYNKGTAKKIQWKAIMTLEDYVAIYLKDAVG